MQTRPRGMTGISVLAFAFTGAPCEVYRVRRPSVRPRPHRMTGPPPLPNILQPLSLTCYEYRGRIGSGWTESHFAVARTPEGASVDIILKLRDPGPPIGRGHYGATSLSSELVFAVLARALGLQVPDYGIADVGPIFANGIPDDAVRNLLVQNLGPNFASVRIRPAPAKWNPDHRTQTLELREALEAVMSFDATIVNGDRARKNPNLLWDGRDTVHVIDHGLACTAYNWPAPVRNASPLMSDGDVQQHSAFAYMQGNGARYEATLQNWRNVATPEFWVALESVVPPSWERQPGDLRSIFDFLIGRDQKLADVSAQLRRLVQ